MGGPSCAIKVRIQTDYMDKTRKSNLTQHIEYCIPPWHTVIISVPCVADVRLVKCAKHSARYHINNVSGRKHGRTRGR